MIRNKTTFKAKEIRSAIRRKLNCLLSVRFFLRSSSVISFSRVGRLRYRMGIPLPRNPSLPQILYHAYTPIHYIQIRDLVRNLIFLEICCETPVYLVGIRCLLVGTGLHRLPLALRMVCLGFEVEGQLLAFRQSQEPS